MSRAQIETRKVVTAEDRAAALRVISEVFQGEKNWIANADSEIPMAIADTDRMSWFLTSADGEPVGVIRLAYDPPLQLPAHFEVKFDRPLDLEEFARGRRFVEIGRFMIVPEFRRNIRVVFSLMRSAVREVVERGYTHFLTDVYESDPHSPYGFHTRVLGFERIGTHRFGELNCDSLRIILVLDIVRACRKLTKKRDRIYRELVTGLEPLIAALPASPPL